MVSFSEMKKSKKVITSPMNGELRPRWDRRAHGKEYKSMREISVKYSIGKG
jgi:hypothetical protein